MPELTVAGDSLTWSCRRSRRAKRVRIVVREGRVEVVAPLRTPRVVIEEFVGAKREWIRAKVAAWRERAVEALPERFESGGRVLYRGRHLELAVEPAPGRGI